MEYIVILYIVCLFALGFLAALFITANKVERNRKTISELMDLLTEESFIEYIEMKLHKREVDSMMEMMTDLACDPLSFITLHNHDKAQNSPLADFFRNAKPNKQTVVKPSKKKGGKK